MKSTIIKLAGSADYFTQESYKALRTNVQFCGQDIKVISITSCYESEGKTVVSLNLAKSLAELGKRVLYIDADMRRSVVAARHTGTKNPCGLSELLTGQEELSECVYETQLPNLHIIFSGKYPPNPVELLNGRYFTKLIEYARTKYDYVLVDTPPLGRVIDSAVISPICDGVILVMASSAIRYPVAQEVVEQLRKSGSKILGVVRNNFNRSQKIRGQR